MFNEQKLSKNIAEAVKLYPHSKKRLAAELGISPPTLSQYLSGRIFPSLFTFRKLCIVLDISADEILEIKAT